MSSDDSTFRSLVENSVDTIFRMTPACEILYVSPAVRRQLGYEPNELLGKVIFDLIHEPDRPIARAAAARSAEPGVDNCPGTQRWMHKDGHLVWIEVNGRMVRGENGQPNEIIIVTRDISGRKALEEQLEQLATTDALTGLRNRRGFDEVLDREWKRTMRTGSPTSLLLLDLDHFKRLNDAYGHAVGDDCLRTAAQAFRAAVRREIDEVFRYGGEELAAILPHTDLEGAIQLAESDCGVAGAAPRKSRGRRRHDRQHRRRDSALPRWRDHAHAWRPAAGRRHRALQGQAAWTQPRGSRTPHHSNQITTRLRVFARLVLHVWFLTTFRF